MKKYIDLKFHSLNAKVTGFCVIAHIYFGFKTKLAICVEKIRKCSLTMTTADFVFRSNDNLKFTGYSVFTCKTKEFENVVYEQRHLCWIVDVSLGTQKTLKY